MINMYKSELTNLQQGILNFLFANPTKEFNMLRLSQVLGVSQPAIKKAMPFLAKKDYIKLSKDKESKRYAIFLNRDNPEIIYMKRVKNLDNIYSSGLVKFLFELFPGSTIILFGSYSFGEDTEKSDVDIAVIGSEEKELNLAIYEKAFGRVISINFFNSFREIKDNNLKNNILNGIVLSGSVKL